MRDIRGFRSLRRSAKRIARTVKIPNPAVQEAAEAKRQRRQQRNLNNIAAGMTRSTRDA